MEFFTFSKVFGAIIQPLNAALILLLVAAVLAWMGKWRAGRALLTIVVAGLFAVLVLPIGSWLLLPLEQRYPQLEPLPATVDGIVMLGGAQQPRLTHAHGQPAMNGRAERMTTFLALARRYPEAKLVFSGGSGDVTNQQIGERETVRLFLEQQGFDADRVVYETKSRNTFENALHTQALVPRKPGETWLLVTSAADVPRAMGVFAALGWTMIPVPCDYEALPFDKTAEAGWTPSFSLLESMAAIDHALHEWAGLLVYYVTGKTDRLFPGP